jgi:pseudouridine-5'-phosphate glycosidase
MTTGPPLAGKEVTPWLLDRISWLALSLLFPNHSIASKSCAELRTPTLVLIPFYLSIDQSD